MSPTDYSSAALERMYCKNCSDPGYWHGGGPNHCVLDPSVGDRCWGSVDNEHYCKCKGFTPQSSKALWSERPSWDEYFTKIAEVVSSRATCNRMHVGVVIVNHWDHRILACGYNGAPAGAKHCPDDESLAPDDRCIISNHAEQNAVNFASRAGVNIQNADWYFWPVGPCPTCLEKYVNLAWPARLIFPVKYS